MASPIVSPLIALVLVAAPAAPPGEGTSRPRPYTDEELRKEPILWGSERILPDGSGLSFGGNEQAAEDGQAHTRIREGSAWKPIVEELRSRNPLQRHRDDALQLRSRAKGIAARARALWFEGLDPAEGARRVEETIAPTVGRLAGDLLGLTKDLEREVPGLDPSHAPDARAALGLLESARAGLEKLAGSRGVRIRPAAVRQLSAAKEDLDRAAERLDAEPPPRALSPIAFEEKTGLFVLFGGDHLDYLTNDTWVFDPRERRWSRRRPPSAPSPRANHRLEAPGDGTVVLSGGFTYTSSTDYCGGEYRDLADGSWTYDVAADAWSGTARAAAADLRAYREGPFHPDHFIDRPPPDAAGFERFLRDLPANAWVLTRPPRIPRQNRDWGTAVLDPARDLILYFSGGHCAHGGSDVLHFHLRTNRWELPFPVEFPLGQLYTNTAYPWGFNFNRRPWPTGHTYLAYALDPRGKLVFIGHRRHAYLYDPDLADWIGRTAKPDGMTYDDCFYDLNSCAVPGGIAVWTKEGRIFRSTSEGEFAELRIEGTVPGSSVDSSVMVHDSRRDRLLLLRTGYGKDPDGEVYEVDLKTLAARALRPSNRSAAASAGRFGIDRGAYLPGPDLLLLATLLPAGPDGSRRTPAYDAAGNRWVSLALRCEAAGEADGPPRLVLPGAAGEPLTPRGHSSAIVHDPKRDLVWGVDAACRVYVLRLDPAAAGIRGL